MTRADGNAGFPDRSVSLEHFIGLYLTKNDPCDTAIKWHDQRKYAVTVASLPRPRYRRCYEPGCSIGQLTAMLAGRCDEVLATDAVAEAVAHARQTVAALPHVRVEQALLPAELPSGTFDLIVVSDLLYYLSAADLDATMGGLVDRLDPGGDLVAVHFRDPHGGSHDGSAVHAELARRPGLSPVVHHEDEWFLLDVLRPER